MPFFHLADNSDEGHFLGFGDFFQGHLVNLLSSRGCNKDVCGGNVCCCFLNNYGVADEHGLRHPTPAHNKEKRRSKSFNLWYYTCCLSLVTWTCFCSASLPDQQVTRVSSDDNEIRIEVMHMIREGT